MSKASTHQAGHRESNPGFQFAASHQFDGYQCAGRCLGGERAGIRRPFPPGPRSPEGVPHPAQSLEQEYYSSTMQVHPAVQWEHVWHVWHTTGGGLHRKGNAHEQQGKPQIWTTCTQRERLPGAHPARLASKAMPAIHPNALPPSHRVWGALFTISKAQFIHA